MGKGSEKENYTYIIFIIESFCGTPKTDTIL